MIQPPCRRHSWYTDEHLVGYVCLDCAEECAECLTCVREDRAGRPTGSSLLICDDCLAAERKVLDELAEHLARIPDVAEVAESLSVVKAVAYDQVMARGAADPERLPFGWDALVDDWYQGPAGARTRDGVLELVDAWVTQWRDARDEPTADAGRAGTAYLRDHLLWAAQNPDVSAWSDYRQEIRVIRGRARALDPEAPEKVGPRCLDCGGPLVRRWRKDGLGDDVLCQLCEKPYTDITFRQAVLAELQRHAAQHSPDALVTVAEARRIFPDLAHDTIQTWITRDRDRAERARKAGVEYVRRLPERGRRRGQKLYRLGDIAAKANPGAVARAFDDAQMGA